jgi:hypothetical protein
MGGGGRLGAAWGEERSGEGGAGVWRRVSRHGTGTEAPSRSDSGRRRGRAATRGCGGHERRERSGGQVGRDDAGARWAAAGCGRRGSTAQR